MKRTAGGREICEGVVSFGEAESEACVRTLRSVRAELFSDACPLDATILQKLDTRVCFPMRRLPLVPAANSRTHADMTFPMPTVLTSKSSDCKNLIIL